MEPIAALSFAASVLQIVQFTAKLISTSQQIYEAGVDTNIAQATLVVQDFRELNGTIRAWAQRDSSSRQSLTKDNEVHITNPVQCSR